MKKRKSEIATIVMIGAVVVMGVTAIISSFTQQDKKTTRSMAREIEEPTPRPTLRPTSAATPTASTSCIYAECADGTVYWKKAGKFYKKAGCATLIPDLSSWCGLGGGPSPTRVPTMKPVATSTPKPAATRAPTAPASSSGPWTRSCCFTYPDGPKNDRYGCAPGVKYVRVYATAENRNINEMTTACEATSGYGADRFFECDQTSDGCEGGAVGGGDNGDGTTGETGGVGSNGAYSNTDLGFYPQGCGVDGPDYRDQRVFKCCDKNGLQPGCYESPCDKNRLQACSDVVAPVFAEPTVDPESSDAECQSSTGIADCNEIDSQDPYNSYSYEAGQCCPRGGLAVPTSKPDQEYDDAIQPTQVPNNGTSNPLATLTPVPAENLTKTQRIQQYCDTTFLTCMSPKYLEWVGRTRYCCDFDPNDSTAFGRYSSAQPSPTSFTVPEGGGYSEDLKDYKCTGTVTNECSPTLLSSCSWITGNSGKTLVNCKKNNDSINRNYCCPKPADPTTLRMISVFIINSCEGVISVEAKNNNSSDYALTSNGNDTVLYVMGKTDDDISVTYSNEVNTYFAGCPVTGSNSCKVNVVCKQ